MKDFSEINIACTKNWTVPLDFKTKQNYHEIKVKLNQNRIR